MPGLDFLLQFVRQFIILHFHGIVHCSTECSLIGGSDGNGKCPVLLVTHTHTRQQFILYIYRRASAQGNGNGIAGTGIDVAFYAVLTIAEPCTEGTVHNPVNEDVLQFNTECRGQPTEEVMRQRTVGLYSTQGKCYRLRLKEPQRDYYAAQTILLAKQENVGAMVGDLGHYVGNNKLYHIKSGVLCLLLLEHYSEQHGYRQCVAREDVPGRCPARKVCLVLGQTVHDLLRHDDTY